MDTRVNLEKKSKTYRQKIEEHADDWPHDVSKVVSCINHNMFDPQPTMDWWKDECDIKDHNFSAKFAHYIGEPPKKYIIHHRIEFAKVLLKNTNVSVSSIAFEVGFRSVSAFCNTFKSKKNIAPSAWREKRKN